MRGKGRDTRRQREEIRKAEMEGKGEGGENADKLKEERNGEE